MTDNTSITLTLDALRSLLAAATPAATPAPSPSASSIVSEYPALVRTYADGVWIGTVIEETGCRVVLKDCRCLWYWDEATPRLGLPGVAVRGPDRKDKVTVQVDRHICLDAVGITPLAADVHAAWMAHPSYHG